MLEDGDIDSSSSECQMPMKTERLMNGECFVNGERLVNSECEQTLNIESLTVNGECTVSEQWTIAKMGK